MKRGRELAKILRAGLSEEVALCGVLNKGHGRQPGSDVGNSVLSRRNSKGKCSLRETGMQDAGPGCRARMQDRDARLGCRTGMQDRDVGPGCRTGMQEWDAGMGCRTRMQGWDVEERGHLVQVMETLGDGFCPARNPSHLPFQR